MACVYNGWWTDEMKELLPADLEGRQFVARIENGKVVEVRKGLPERVVGAMLPTPVDTSGQKAPESCETDAPDRESAKEPADPVAQ